MTATLDCCGTKCPQPVLVNFVAAQCGGKGGGKPDMAMAGASDVKALPAALESARAWIAEKLA